jgi:hypothetical protein
LLKLKSNVPKKKLFFLSYLQFPYKRTTKRYHALKFNVGDDIEFTNNTKVESIFENKKDFLLMIKPF